MPNSSPLRGHILRLAAQNLALRPQLIEILKEAGGISEQELMDFLPSLAPAAAAPHAVPPVVVQINNHQDAPGTTAPSVVLPAAPVVAPAPVAAPAPEEPEKAPVSSMFVPERAQQGFNAELVPEMDKLVASGLPRDQVARDMLDLIQDSFTKKDSLFNILIRHQSSFESNEEYQMNMERMIEAWATSNSGA